jgi:hypothetical protein
MSVRIIQQTMRINFTKNWFKLLNFKSELYQNNMSLMIKAFLLFNNIKSYSYQFLTLFPPIFPSKFFTCYSATTHLDNN